MIYVFDSSFIAAQIIPDEKTPHSLKLYSKITGKDERHTPQLLWYEITNVFYSLIRRKRYTHIEIVYFYKPLLALNLITDLESGVNYSHKIFRLSNDYNLSSYDAAYLELAERKKATLCTLDNNLRNAAKKHGVTVI